MQPMAVVFYGLSPRKFQTEVLVELLTPIPKLAVMFLEGRPHSLGLITGLRSMLHCKTSRNTSGPANITMRAGLNWHERVAIAARSLSAGLADQNFYHCCQPGPIAQMLKARPTARPCLLGPGVAACAATLLLMSGVKHSCRFPDHVLNFVCLSLRSDVQESDHRWVQKVRMGNWLLMERSHLALRRRRILIRCQILMGSHLLKWRRMLIRYHLLVKRSRLLILIRGKKVRILVRSHLVVRGRLLVRSYLVLKRRRLLILIRGKKARILVRRNLVVRGNLLIESGLHMGRSQLLRRRSWMMMSHLLRLELVVQKRLVKCFLVLRAQRATAEITLMGLGLLLKSPKTRIHAGWLIHDTEAISLEAMNEVCAGVHHGNT
ncbi:hypothetical protein GE21DRAFT_5036 [Neurospora crassa]|uniref:Uncharacterized protein n=1 Tax=Neurospora crassa (strain ATCC 24698 / 74-OR23-1A / CBS 708.71 / DSM 1257 / FGSC 987) TaxID=367110 RepID=Q7S3J0_NEUCR|nr:hypothetical protein NCU08253 [Neurospora crassa OR74A]EAA30107.3 hypothetical protein NCU08253 [Neurospora crassa OR74A]KHE86511.1 hypothetical protein GE21DRAFT_5036 [Neurospora crassa]|eukprot:XP_959343.3 hypothetical protein NCU08253 [Neurospora crassa OR74A]